MTRKTKDENVELIEKTNLSTAKSKKSVGSSTVSKKEEKVSKKSNTKTVNSKKAEPKKSSTKKAVNSKKADLKKDSTKKSVSSKKSASAKDSTKKTTSLKKEPKKVTTKLETSKKTSIKKTDENKSTKKSSSSKELKAKKTTKKASTRTTKKASTVKPRTKKAKVISIEPTIEYYDLPYRYNETTVKVLAQNPNTLFAYWDISDADRENFEKKYGKMFFYNTRPVLIVHNLTNNYTFEVEIDDFANNWYIYVDNSKCKYSVELGRRPKYDGSASIPINYLNVAFSNVIEIPNDRILFFKENDKIYFKNVKTNVITEKIFKKRTHLSKVKAIYKNYNLSENEDRFDFKNPSSQNPTSTFL